MEKIIEALKAQLQGERKRMAECSDRELLPYFQGKVAGLEEALGLTEFYKQQEAA